MGVQWADRKGSTTTRLGAFSFLPSALPSLTWRPAGVPGEGEGRRYLDALERITEAVRRER